MYEGTPLYRTRPDGSPFRTGVRTIARMNTEASVILELRRELPPHVGHRMWCCLSTSLTGVFVPFHVGIEAVEPHFATASAGYDAALGLLAVHGAGEARGLPLPALHRRITSTWRTFEAETFSALPAVEARAAGLGVEEACALLTEFDRGRPRPRSRPCSGCCRR